MEHIIGIGASLRQNGKPLLITRTKLEHQRRQILNARAKAEFNIKYPLTPTNHYVTGECVGGKGLERQLDRS